MRFFGYTLGDESIPFEQPTAEAYQEMEAFIGEATKAGMLIATGGISPTSEGFIVTRKNGEFTVTDGPFAESKELIGGWAIMECRDKDEAIYWTKRFLDVAGDGETRIRPIEQAI